MKCMLQDLSVLGVLIRKLEHLALLWPDCTSQQVGWPRIKMGVEKKKVLLQRLLSRIDIWLLTKWLFLHISSFLKGKKLNAS